MLKPAGAPSSEKVGLTFLFVYLEPRVRDGDLEVSFGRPGRFPSSQTLYVSLGAVIF